VFLILDADYISESGTHPLSNGFPFSLPGGQSRAWGCSNENACCVTWVFLTSGLEWSGIGPVSSATGPWRISCLWFLGQINPARFSRSLWPHRVSGLYCSSILPFCYFFGHRQGDHFHNNNNNTPDRLR
jgi:hypothetical protein